MKTAITNHPDFQPFTFSVTVETEAEAEMLRHLYSESSTLADRLNDAIECGWSEANQLFESLGLQAQRLLSR